MWQVQFALLAVIWGSSFLLIKVAGEDLTPVQISFGRIAIGSIALGLVLLITRQPLPKFGRLWGHLAIAGLLTNAIPFTLFAVGEQHLSSVIAGLWNATMPLFAVVAIVVLLGERPTRGGLVGVAIGFAGVILLLAPWRDLAAHDLLSHLAFMIASACYGFGAPYMRKHLSHTNESAIAMSCTQLGCAALMLLVILPFAGGVPHGVDLATAASITALGALGSGLAYALLYSVIRAVGPTIAASVTYVMPVVSTTLGVLILDEPLTWNLLLGGAVVLVGVLVGARANARRNIVTPAATTP
jgi:drug/metabolite transporter (DMT)-like permease